MKKYVVRVSLSRPSCRGRTERTMATEAVTTRHDTTRHDETLLKVSEELLY